MSLALLYKACDLLLFSHFGVAYVKPLSSMKELSLDTERNWQSVHIYIYLYKQ